MDYQSFQPNPPGQQMSEQIPSVQKNFTPKFIWTVVGLLVLGGVAYAGIWWWQNQQVAQEVVPTFTPRADETADWKTYRNEEYGFEFRYPLSLKDYSFGEIDYMFTVGSLFSVQFVDFDNSPNNETERGHALNKTKSQLLLEKENIQKEGTLLINGMKALIKNQAGDGLFRTATIFTPNNDKIWFVMQLDLLESIFRDYINKDIPIPESVFQSPENQRRIKVFDQILSTFKFTNSDITNKATQDVIDAIAKYGSAQVIVSLKGNEFTSPEYLSDDEKKKFEIRKIQNRVLATLTVNDWSGTKLFDYIAAFAGTLTKSGLTKLNNNFEVIRISLDKAVPLTNSILLQINSEGGRCSGGPCVVTVVVKTDGSYVKTAGGKINAQGQLTLPELNSISSEILATDFNAVMSKKFTDTCPSADDGMENIYTLYLPDGTQRISDCVYDLDYKSGLFFDLKNFFFLPRY